MCLLLLSLKKMDNDDRANLDQTELYLCSTSLKLCGPFWAQNFVVGGGAKTLEANKFWTPGSLLARIMWVFDYLEWPKIGDRAFQ